MCSGDRENVLGVGNYCYVASARRRARRWGAHGGRRGAGAYRAATHTACFRLNSPVTSTSPEFVLPRDTVAHYLTRLVNVKTDARLLMSLRTTNCAVLHGQMTGMNEWANYAATH